MLKDVGKYGSETEENVKKIGTLREKHGTALSESVLSAPADTHLPSHCAPTPIPRSIGENHVGAKGASTLAAILKETQITTLQCAANR